MLGVCPPDRLLKLREATRLGGGKNPLQLRESQLTRRPTAVRYRSSSAPKSFTFVKVGLGTMRRVAGGAGRRGELGRARAAA